MNRRRPAVLDPAPSPSGPTALKPPQFGLRTMLAMVAFCAALLALRQWLPPVAILTLVLLASSIFCHVAGNAIGTRLRQIGDFRQSPSGALPGPDHCQPQAQDFAPVTRLSERRSLGLPIAIATGTGLTSGAVGGGLWTYAVSRGQVGVLNIAVGAVAFGVLGGIASFAVVALVQVLLGAIWQALKSSSVTTVNKAADFTPP